MMIILVTALLIASATGNVIKSTPFQCQEAEVVKHCEDLITVNMPNLPGFVRLAFHDCVGDNGCNGCLDLGNGDNNGMKVYMDRLDAKYDEKKIRDTMSRADFWILCSHVAIKIGQKNSELPNDASSLKLKMKYGRKDCNEESPNQASPTDAYPSPHGNYSRTTGYFEAEFGLSADETIALLGAHTLGRARKEDSGFSNPWVDKEFVFDNTFYTDILNKELKWIQVDLDDNDLVSHPQWSQNVTSPPKNMMLSADMCLAVDVNPDAGGNETRKFNDIGPSPGASLVLQYSENNKKWLEDFSVAYTKMVEKTGADNQLLDAQPDGKSSPCKAVGDSTTVPSSTASALPSVLLLSFLTFLNTFNFIKL